MRILLGVNNMRRQDGGPPIVVGGLALALQSAGAAVEVMASTLEEERVSTQAHWRTLADAGIKLHQFSYSGPRSIFHSLPLVRFAAQQTSSFDILHNHGVWELSLLGAAERWRIAKKPYFISAHGTLDAWSMTQSAWKKKLALVALGTRKYLDGASGVIFGTQSECDEARRLSLASPAFVVPNGFDPAQFKNGLQQGKGAPQPSIPQMGHWDRTILFYSRLHPKKGLDLLVEAFSQLAGEFPDAGLLAAGIPEDKPYEMAIRARILELGLQDRAVLTTELIGPAGRQVLYEADIYVQPSHQEGFSMSLVEAMGVGLPLLITNRCHMEFVEHEGAGLVVSPTIEGIKTGLRAMLSVSPKELRKMGRRGKELSRQFSWESVAQQMVNHYENALAR